MNDDQRPPDPDDDLIEILAYAATFDAYQRWADSPVRLAELLTPVHHYWATHGTLPAWAGIDTLRALLFYEYRADRFTGGGGGGETRIRAVCAELRDRHNRQHPQQP